METVQTICRHSLIQPKWGFKDSAPVCETVFTTTINKTLNDRIFCERMWENIPPVQLHRSTVYAKARLSSFGGSLWPRSQLRHLLLMFPSFWLHLLQTFSHLGPYLLPPSSPCLPCGRSKWEGESVCACVWVSISLTLQWVFADACVNDLWAGMKLRKAV